jgi:hypothetical protein
VLATSRCGADTAHTPLARAAYTLLSQGLGMFLEMTSPRHACARRSPRRHSAHWPAPSAHCVLAARAGVRTWRTIPALHCVPMCALSHGAAHTNMSTARRRCAGLAPADLPPPHFASLCVPSRAVPDPLLCPSRILGVLPTRTRRLGCWADSVHADPPYRAHFVSRRPAGMTLCSLSSLACFNLYLLSHNDFLRRCLSCFLKNEMLSSA